MTNLNFHPYYEQLLRKKEKFTTIRLGDRRSEFHVGDIVTITIAWDDSNEKNIMSINNVKIIDVVYKQIQNITDNDLIGESPDCISSKALPYVLSGIYRTLVKDNDFVTILRWKYLS